MTDTRIPDEARMIAFHGDPKVQAKYINRVEAHFDADEIIKGQYWEHGKGCAVGCTIHGSDHSAFESEIGVPVQIAGVFDAIFEGLPNEQAKQWPLAVLTAIPLGADLSNVWPQFAAWLMTDPTYGVEYTTDDAEITALCREVARRYLSGETAGTGATALTDKLWAARNCVGCEDCFCRGLGERTITSNRGGRMSIPDEATTLIDALEVTVRGSQGCSHQCQCAAERLAAREALERYIDGLIQHAALTSERFDVE